MDAWGPLVFPVLSLIRLDFLPGTAIMTPVRVFKEACDEKELRKQGCLPAGARWVVLELVSRASRREDLSWSPNFQINPSSFLELHTISEICGRAKYKPAAKEKENGDSRQPI